MDSYAKIEAIVLESSILPVKIISLNSSKVLTGHLLREMRRGTYRNLLFCGTGALHSPTATMQGESIPGICHAVAITTEKGGAS